MKTYTQLSAMAKSARTSENPKLVNLCLDDIHETLSELHRQISKLKSEFKSIDELGKMAQSEPAKLKFQLFPPEGYDTVAVWDGDEISVYYENEETGDMIEVDWPFDAETIYTHDCELLGIIVE